MTRSTFYLRQYMTKALSITLILGLLLSSLALSSGLSESLNTIAQALTTSGNWIDEGNYSIDWYTNYKDERGSESEPYLIESAEDLAGLAYLAKTGINNKPINFVNKVIKLTADIDLGEHYWTPIGTNWFPFRGTFNGNDCTIKNMLIGTESALTKYVCSGLFGNVSGATIKNINIDANSKIYSSGDNTGTICGTAYNSKIINCTSNGTIRVVDDVEDGYNKTLYQVGGICGCATGSTEIKNCVNRADILSDAPFDETNIGGIVARIIGRSSNIEIINCINYGTIDAKCYDEDQIKTIASGGIVGLDDISTTKIINCINSGSVTSNYAGGICGYSNNKKNLTISNSINVGEVSAINGVGGIIGFDKTSKAVLDETYYKESCVNKNDLEYNIAIGNVETTDNLALSEKEAEEKTAEIIQAITESNEENLAEDAV